MPPLADDLAESSAQRANLEGVAALVSGAMRVRLAAYSLSTLTPASTGGPPESLSDRSVRNTRLVPRSVREGAPEIVRVARGATPTHDHLRSRLVIILLATIVLDAMASVLVFLFERHAEGTEITTLGDSLFWTSTQLLTVSSQLPNPISTPARVFDVFLQAYAISVVAMLAGSFGAFFHRREIERDPLDSSAGA